MKIEEVHVLFSMGTKIKEAYAWVGDAPDGKESIMMAPNHNSGGVIPLVASSKVMAEMMRPMAHGILGQPGAPTKIRLVKFKRVKVMEQLS